MTLDMSQPSRRMGFRPQSILRPHAQVGSGDPSVNEEAHNLLLQFLRHPSHGTEGPRNEKIALHNDPTVQTENSPGSVDDCQVVYVISDDSAPESASDKHRVSRQKTARSPRVGSSRTTALSGTSFDDAGHDNQTETALPTARRKHARSTIANQNRRTPYSLSPSSDKRSPARHSDKAIRMRRSARSRTGPANYYERLDLFNSDPEKEPYDNGNKSVTMDSSAQPQQPHGRTCSYGPSASPSHRDNQCLSSMQHSIVYSSPTVQILKSPFKTLDEFKNVEHARYSPERNPADYARRLRKEDLVGGKILHFDFDREEMAAVLSLMSFSGFQRSFAPEIALTDQLIQVASTCDMQSRAFKNITHIIKLSKLLSAEEVSDSNASLLGILESKSDTKELRRARRLVLRILGSQEQCNSEVLHTLGEQLRYQDEDLRRLSACLPFASALGRRQCTDIETFIGDAKNGCLSSNPSFIKAIKPEGGSRISRKTVEASGNLNRLLQNRELGCVGRRQINSHVSSNLKLSKTWKGASNDVIVLAWSPDGTRFAAGATTQCDEHNMVYNRGNNLILGDLTTNSLEELSDHWIHRPFGDSRRTVNDYRLFMSVTACQWFEDTLYTASYDNTVKLWKFPNHGASCYKTLHHDSKVQLMARSNFDTNLLATGTHSFGFWEINESKYSRLEIPRQRSKRDVELMPTSLAWGTLPMTKELLIAGMSEKGDGVSYNGLLAAWRINEASATPIQLSPNSQNIFDIKWHSYLPLFATASSARGWGTTNLSSKSTRSVVRLYSPLTSKMCTMEFECPALDINDVTFCPSYSNYVTASCTDGITYVWDNRNPDTMLHKLQHGDPLNQIDETLTREQADVGVRLALWGDSVNRFYTGSSDGILKNWNILRSPDDALVQDVASFQEEIMCGLFSEDKSNLLIGDAAGGLHLLSPSAYTDDSLSFKFKRAPQLPLDDCDSDSGSGVKAGRKAISAGRLVRHPIYGVGQGPHYSGPYAAWARADGTPVHQLAQTKLTDEWQLRQLDGPPPVFRIGLNEQLRQEVEAQRQLAEIRNGKYTNKRKRLENGYPMKTRNVIDLCSDDGKPGFWNASVRPKRLAPESKHMTLANTEIEIIDLTADSDAESADADSSIPSPQDTETHFSGLEQLLEALKESLEDDHWWPPSGHIDPNLQEADV